MDNTDDFLNDIFESFPNFENDDIKSSDTQWWSNFEENPAVLSWQKRLLQMQDESRIYAEKSLFQDIARLAEHPDIAAHACGLFLLKENGTLFQVASHNLDICNRNDISIDDFGIVPHVARTQKEYCADDVHSEHEKEYYEDLESTKSEFAIPVIWDGKLLAVLNLESRSENGFDNRAKQIIRNSLSQLVLNLFVLRAIYDKEADWCPWHPMVHGWDLTDTLSSLFRVASNEIGPATTKFSLWYSDLEDKTGFVYSAYGYDLNFLPQDRVTLFGSQVEQVLNDCSSNPVVFNPQASGYDRRKQKAIALSIDEAIGIRIDLHPSSNAKAALICMFSRRSDETDGVEANNRELAKDALMLFRTYLERLIFAYRQSRKLYAKVQLQRAMDKCDRDGLGSAAKCDVFLSCMQEFFIAPAGSVFVFDPVFRRLTPVATTGFFDRSTGGRDFKLKAHAYCLRKQKKTHTVVTFKREGKALIRSDVGRSGERCFSFIANHRSPEYIPFDKEKEFKGRRFIGCALRFDGECYGVFRLTRPSTDRPFTHFDKQMFELLCEIELQKFPKLSPPPRIVHPETVETIE